MEHDKVFNLQLTIQKLQEEVSLYRNGADSEEIFQLIAEKEIEIKSLNASAISKNENLRKLAKKSAEVLARCDRVQADYDTLQFEHSDLIQVKKQLITDIESLQGSNVRSALRCDEGKQTIVRLEEELSGREDSIEKLQARCAQLVSQKNEKTRECEAMAMDISSERSEKNKHMTELIDELERAMRFNTEIKERLNREHANSLDLSAKLMDTRKTLEASNRSTEELRATCDSLQAVMKDLTRANGQLVSDLFDTKRLLSSATMGASESESQLRSELSARDMEITELNLSIAALMERSTSDSARVDEECRAAVSCVENERRTEVQRVKDECKTEISRVEKECRGEMSRLELECRTEVLCAKEESDTLSKRVNKLESEREVAQSNKKDLDVLRAKNSELEEKIKRQDQYMKSRLLKDKTNYSSSLCTPEPSEPCYRPPSARAIAIAATAATLTGPTTEIRPSSTTASRPSNTASITSSLR